MRWSVWQNEFREIEWQVFMDRMISGRKQLMKNMHNHMPLLSTLLMCRVLREVLWLCSNSCPATYLIHAVLTFSPFPLLAYRDSLLTATTCSLHIQLCAWNCASTVLSAMVVDKNSQHTCTPIVVDVVSQGVHDVPQSFLQDRVWHGFLQGQLEDLQIGGQGVLVHGVHKRHLRQNEK